MAAKDRATQAFDAMDHELREISRWMYEHPETAFTPIINAPEVGILGVARSRMQPVYKDGEFVPRLILPFTLSYDHRVVDGAAAVRFTTHLASTIEDVHRLLEAAP